jgi:hypothetical protein
MVVDSQIVDEKAVSETKRLRLDDQEVANILNQFELVKVLNDNTQSKMIIIQVAKKLQEDASSEEVEKNRGVIIFEKPHFSIESTKSLLSIKNPTETSIDNDIYTKLSVFPVRPYNSTFSELFFLLH